MRMDAQAIFAENQVVTATAASDNFYNAGIARNLGVGRPLYVVCLVTNAMTDSGSDSTVTVTLETDDNDTFASATVAQTLGTFAALSAIGASLVVMLQPNKIDEQYFRPSEVETLHGDASKAREQLDWCPSMGFEDLVREMLDHALALIKKFGANNGR